MTARSEWRPIDTAPKDGTAVLLFHPAWDTIEVGLHYPDTGHWQQPNGDLLKAPTHWTRLPTQPGEQT